MRFRWKLAVLMLIIALLPIVTMRLAGVKFVQHMTDELIRQAGENRIEGLKTRLRLVVNSYAAVLGRGRSQIEMALLAQAEEVERALAGPAPDTGPYYLSGQFKDGDPLPLDTMTSSIHFYHGPDEKERALQVSYSTQVYTLDPGHDTPLARADMARLATVTPFFGRITRRLNGMAFWHYTSLSNGLHGAYPAHDGFPEGVVPTEQPWYSAAFDHDVPWTNPYVDPSTRQVVLAATQPVKRPDGSVAGVTAIVIPVRVLLEHRLLFEGLPQETASFIVYRLKDPDSGRVMPQILARDEYTDVKYRSWRTQVDQGWLTSGDETSYDLFLSDLDSGTGNTRRMAYQGRDSLWTYGPTLHGSFLVLITPYSTILQPAAEARLWVQGLMNQLVTYTGYGIAAIICVVLLLALAFSQTVTRPLGALMEGVQRLTRGDFNIRVDIDTADEFGDLGRLFNSVGPRLKEHGQMRHAMDLAKQVQQSLLPQADPRIEGLDVAGKCVFCDETGGDYYDYLTGAQDSTLTIVVGDVSGHGLPSALLMATARALLRSRTSLGGDIAEIMDDINHQLNLDVEASGQFMAMFYARIASDRRSIQWVRAGHEPGLIYDRASDQFTELDGKGLPLGVFGDTIYTRYEMPLSPDQIIVLGTDGINESMNTRGEMFGKAAFYSVIRANAHLKAQEIVAAVVDALDGFRGSADPKDDITLVVVNVLA
jgi:sigma-B regulation protein RsbU (phosphoserine phosphatase)